MTNPIARRNLGLSLALLLSSSWIGPAALAAEQDQQLIPLDRCIGGKCKKNGRYREVLITPELYIVLIDADRCSGHTFYCPTSYDSFTTRDGTPLEVRGYELGTKTNGTFSVYIPREHDSLYISGINKSERDDLLSLRDFDDYLQARAAASPRAEEAGIDPPRVAGETAIDELFAAASAAYASLDAAALAELYTEDALYLPAQGDVLSGREAIRAGFERSFDAVARAGGSLQISFEELQRSKGDSLAYQVGYFTIIRRDDGKQSSDRGKFSLVFKRVPGTGWRFHVYSPSEIP